MVTNAVFSAPSIFNTRKDTSVNPKPVAVAGVSAVLLLLGGTRWGSYVGANPIFLTDLLLALATVHWVASTKLRRDRFLEVPRTARPPWLLVVVAVYCMGRLLLGQQFDLVALRDAAPYLYSLVGLLAWFATRRASNGSLNRTRKLILVALTFHAFWFLVTLVLLPGLPRLMPALSASQGIHIFTPRADIDTALVGVLAAVLLGRIVRGSDSKFWLLIIGLACCWTAILSTSSRAGLIGAVLANAFALYASMRAQSRVPTRKVLVIALLPLLIGLALIVIPSTDIGARLSGTLGVTAGSSSELSQGAAGTTRARSQAWERLVEWTSEDISRLFWGEGLGPNIMTSSGAGVLLVGTPDDVESEPRSPHNYWAGSLARLGLMGVIPLLVLSVSFLANCARTSSAAGADEFRLILNLVPLSIVVPASLGVVLESPFGAIPFFWCIGALAGLGKTKHEAHNFE
jgi:hypothetical protein